jgi:hypothetical protein
VFVVKNFHNGMAIALASIAVGALGTGAGYEVNSKVQLNRLEDDYKKERISRREYEDRKKQIESGSIIY